MACNNFCFEVDIYLSIVSSQPRCLIIPKESVNHGVLLFRDYPLSYIQPILYWGNLKLICPLGCVFIIKLILSCHLSRVRRKKIDTIYNVLYNYTTVSNESVK